MHWNALKMSWNGLISGHFNGFYLNYCHIATIASDLLVPRCSMEKCPNETYLYVILIIFELSKGIKTVIMRVNIFTLVLSRVDIKTLLIDLLFLFKCVLKSIVKFP